MKLRRKQLQSPELLQFVTRFRSDTESLFKINIIIHKFKKSGNKNHEKNQKKSKYSLQPKSA